MTIRSRRAARRVRDALHPVTLRRANDGLIPDGVAHLTYFAEDVSFTWTGSVGDPILVSPGGYGWPVTDTIPVSGALAWHVGWPRDNAALFQRVCDRWLTSDECSDDDDEHDRRYNGPNGPGRYGN